MSRSWRDAPLPVRQARAESCSDALSAIHADVDVVIAESVAAEDISVVRWEIESRSLPLPDTADAARTRLTEILIEERQQGGNENG